MPLLISFVNQVFTPELRLGLLDEVKDVFQWITPDLPWDCYGATGITSNYKDRLYVCYQSGGVVVYDFQLNILQVSEFQKIKDPHSVLLHKSNLYVVSTGTDEIYRLKIDEDGLVGGEELFWQKPGLEGYERDLVHLNSLCVLENGCFYVTYFGPKHPDGWETTQSGEICNIATDEVLHRALYNPHTVFSLGGEDYLFCESKTGKLWNQDGSTYHIGGYIRGTAMAGNHLIVASSARREISKSTGHLRGRVGAFESEDYRDSKLFFLNANTFEVEITKTLSSYGKEIYDLCWFPDGVLKAQSVSQDAKEIRIASFEENLLGLVKKNETLGAENRGLRLDVSAYQKTIVHQEKRIQEQEDFIRKQQNTMNDHLEIIRKHEGKISQQETQIKEQEGHIKRQAHDILQLRESWSWKLTAPLRWIGKKCR